MLSARRSLIDLADSRRRWCGRRIGFHPVQQRLREQVNSPEAYPREDLNGDGKLKRDDKNLVPLLDPADDRSRSAPRGLGRAQARIYATLIQRLDQ